jgi:uncharacterized DUF497 family protein
MDGLQFEWDPRKDVANGRKHGVSFDEASTVFSDEKAVLIADPGHSKQEDRYVLLGLSSGLRVLVVCHSYRGGRGRIRLISARKAGKHEREEYFSRWRT